MNARREDTIKVINEELANARLSRQNGNRGRTRVCARRAAGWAVGWYVESNRLAETHANALEHLRWLETYPPAGDDVREAATRLVTKLDPDGNPAFEQDPIEDARLIIQELLGLDLGPL
ncbi:MAG: hypothetical protein E4G99_10365 [Anaerolineales bacterium]|nr:MAG: hypothetical protein E4G99_10365 [Anaerolineales bacterium]